MKARNCKWLFSFFIYFAFQLSVASAAEITKANKRAVIVQFDPFEENYVVGDRLVVSQNQVKVGILEISKIKGAKFIARILKGKATPGMSLAKYGVVAETKAKSDEANIETVTARFSSTYVWRGISYRRPFINGTVDLVSSGMLGGISVENFDAPATSEFDIYIGRTITDIDWSITPMITRYTFQGVGGWDAWDFSLSLTYRIFTFDVSYMPQYYDLRSSDIYSRLSTTFGLGERWKILLSLGYSKFSNETNVQFKNYLDYKLALLYSMTEFSAEFAYTDSTRQSLSGESSKDGTAAVTISKRF